MSRPPKYGERQPPPPPESCKCEICQEAEEEVEHQRKAEATERVDYWLTKFLNNENQKSHHHTTTASASQKLDDS